MSGHSISAIVLFIGVAAIALVSQQTERTWETSSSRAPNALIRKELRLGDVPASILRHTQKIHGPLESRIELIGAIPEKVGDVFVLRGWISSDQDLRDVEFKWAVPPGLEVVNGSRAGHISIMDADRPTEVQITLRNLTAENHQVHFIAAGGSGGARFAESAQYNTLLQPVLDAGKDELLKSTEKAAAEDPKTLKIFH